MNEFNKYLLLAIASTLGIVIVVSIVGAYQQAHEIKANNDCFIIVPETGSYDPNLDGEIPIFEPMWTSTAKKIGIDPDDMLINQYLWYWSIRNPMNHELIKELAFQLNVEQDSLNQKQFNERYLYGN